MMDTTSSTHDRNVSFSVAAEWFGEVKVPYKVVVWFNHCSTHGLFNEEPGTMMAPLLQHARPLPGKAGDVAPGPQEAVLAHSAAP